MSERKHRSKEEIIADLDSKIEYHKKCIEALEAKKHATLNPTPRKKRMSQKALVEAIKASGISMEEIAKKLGVTFENQ